VAMMKHEPAFSLSARAVIARGTDIWSVPRPGTIAALG
jgi:hypothetical protein